MANKQRVEEEVYEVSDLVMLMTKHCCREYKQKGKKCITTFMPWNDGPYKVIAAFPEQSEYTLCLLNDKKHTFSGFHANLLKHHIANDPSLFPGWKYPCPGPIVMKDGAMDHHVIDKIIDEHRWGCECQYLVRW
ncbi:hypothetical protein C0995_004644, partial [Termitomyces sp. Mi166